MIRAHDRPELVEGDSAISVRVKFVEHLLKLVFGQGLTRDHHDLMDCLLELITRNGTIAILVEHPEGLCEQLRIINFLQAGNHQLAKLVEIDRSVAILVHLLHE